MKQDEVGGKNEAERPDLIPGQPTLPSCPTNK